MFPDFLGIGAQKAGTTWLHHNLARHPQIWMPPTKELHYFDHDPPSLRRRLFAKPAHLATARQHLREQLLKSLRGAPDRDLGWALRYCLGCRSDAWYASLFPEEGEKKRGEICPGYARLSAEQVGHVHALMPRARIVYLLRNPLERTWSAVAMRFRKPRFGGDVGAASEEQLRAFMLGPKVARHGDYLANLAAWRSHYPEEQIFIGFFDRLREDPRTFLREILEFLGVDSSEEAIPEDVEERRNPGRDERPPEHLLRLLARHHHEQIRALHAHFANPWTERWLAEAERYL